MFTLTLAGMEAFFQTQRTSVGEETIGFQQMVDQQDACRNLLLGTGLFDVADASKPVSLKAAVKCLQTSNAPATTLLRYVSDMLLMVPEADLPPLLLLCRRHQVALAQSVLPFIQQVDPGLVPHYQAIFQACILNALYNTKATRNGVTVAFEALRTYQRQAVGVFYKNDALGYAKALCENLELLTIRAYTRALTTYVDYMAEQESPLVDNTPQTVAGWNAAKEKAAHQLLTDISTWLPV